MFVVKYFVYHINGSFKRHAFEIFDKTSIILCVKQPDLENESHPSCFGLSDFLNWFETEKTTYSS